MLDLSKLPLIYRPKSLDGLPASISVGVTFESRSVITIEGSYNDPENDLPIAICKNRVIRDLFSGIYGDIRRDLLEVRARSRAAANPCQRIEDFLTEAIEKLTPPDVIDRPLITENRY